MTRAEPTIAVVDDESPVRVALARVLRLAGYEVLAYASAEELLASLERCVPDCAVLDVHLPGLTGFELELRLRSTHPRIAIVFITASDITAAGSARLLHKPFSNAVLLEAVSAALARAP